MNALGFWHYVNRPWEPPARPPTSPWLIALVGCITTIFALILGVEHGRNEMDAVLRLTYGQELHLSQHPGLWVRMIGDCDISPPARCQLVQVVQLDMSQADVVIEPFPLMEPKKETNE